MTLSRRSAAAWIACLLRSNSRPPAHEHSRRQNCSNGSTHDWTSWSGSRDAPARQHTLRATIEWSHDLLSAEEQAAFARLSVFCGGCTPAAAEQVTRATRNHLDALTEKNLLVRGDGRYAMLDTIRELANEQLEASCEADAIRATHAACYLQLGEQTMPETKALQGLSHERTEQLAVLIGSELDNLRAAFRWFVDHDQPEQALQVHLGMSLIWAQGGRDDEAQHGCREALAANGDLSDLTKGLALLLYGCNLVLGDRGLEAEPVLFEALDVVRRLGARRERQRGTALVLRMLALVASGAGNLDRARHFFEQALSIDPEDEDVANMLLYGLGNVEIDAGNLSRARTLIADALTRARRSQQFLSELWCLSLLADLDRLESSLDRAEAGYQQSLRLANRSPGIERSGHA